MNFIKKTVKIFTIFKPSTLKNAAGSAWLKLQNSKNRFKQTVNSIVAAAKADQRERNRVMLLSVSGLCLFGYLMICMLTDKNVFNIFPPVPAIKETKKINIYIPSESCTEIIQEERRVFSDLKDDKLVHRIFYLVAAGSRFENTMSNVPAKFIIKKIWIVDSEEGDGKTCLIDLMPVIIEKEIVVVKGSEQMFRDALEKTIIENVPGIKKVILLEKGVPYKKLWDI